MKGFTKFLKWFLGSVLGLIVFVVLFILISGNTYMFFMLRHTVLEGRMGPTITEYQIYENRVVEASDKPKEWPYSQAYGKVHLSSDDEAYHEKYGTGAYLVVHKGELVYEQYWDPVSDTSHTNSWSVAKSIVSHLIGCAIKDGLIQDVSDPIGKYLDEYAGEKVTIKDLLTMSSGINFDEGYKNPFGYPARTLYGSDLRKVHKRYHVTEDPGKVFKYRSGNSQLLAFIITKVTGKTVSEYASEKLWKPIGAKYDAYWSLDHKGGDERAYCCFNTNARDFARFGYLYLNKGVVNGDTLIDPAYFLEATVPANLMLESGEPNKKYGYQWWCANYEGEEFFYARGINSQYVFILPHSDLIVVRLGRTKPSERIGGHPVDVFEYIRMAKKLVAEG